MVKPSRFAVALATLGIGAAIVPDTDAHRGWRHHPRHRTAAVIVVGQPIPLRRAVVVGGRPHGVLDMNVKPRATEVWTDGAFRGTCEEFDGRPDKLPLLPGVHRIRLVTPSGREVVREVLVRAGLELNVGLDLRGS